MVYSPYSTSSADSYQPEAGSVESGTWVTQVGYGSGYGEGDVDRDIWFPKARNRVIYPLTWEVKV